MHSVPTLENWITNLTGLTQLAHIFSAMAVNSPESIVFNQGFLDY